MTQSRPTLGSHYAFILCTLEGSVLHIYTTYDADCSIRSNVIRGSQNFQIERPIRYTDSRPYILKELHWLPIDARIKFKIAMLTFKVVNTGNLPYLASLLHRHTPCRTSRSASANLSRDVSFKLVIWYSWFPYSCSHHLGNSLPANACSCVTLSTFRRHLFKITPLSVQLPHCLTTYLSVSNSLRPWRYINLLTYLLTLKLTSF